MNNFFRHLSLPFEFERPAFVDEVKFNYPYNSSDLQKDYGYFDQTAIKWFNDLGLEITHTEGFQTPPGGSVPIHNDGGTYCKINISFGDPNGVIRWWHTWRTTNRQPKIIDNERQYQADNMNYANIEDCTQLAETTTNQPTLVNVDILHDTYNPIGAPHRWTICYVPKINSVPITWAEGLEIFKGYFKE